MGKIRGTVKWWNHEKGFGFITAEENPEGFVDVFAHFTHLRDGYHVKLDEGDIVEFEMVEHSRGHVAHDVHIVERKRLVSGKDAERFLIESKINEKRLELKRLQIKVQPLNTAIFNLEREIYNLEEDLKEL